MSESIETNRALPRVTGVVLAWPAWLVVAILAALVYVPGLGERSLWFPDEPDVAEPAISMVLTGDWTVPRHNDLPWADYPPLTYWASATSASLLGVSPFAMRLPVALAAILLLALTALVVERLAGRATAVFAGLAMATAPQFMFQSIMVHPDMFFALFQGAGIAAYAYGLTRPSTAGSWAWRAAAFAAFGLAVLSKGPLGLLLPGFILTLWHLSSGFQWRRILAMAPLTLVALVMAIPWYLMFARAIGAEDVWRELYLQNFARFVDADRGHGQPWYYYLVDTWAQWLPWCIFIPGALWAAWRDRSDPYVRLAFIWFVASFVFLSLATTKRPVYLMPAYPALAYLIARHGLELAERGVWFRARRGAVVLISSLMVGIGAVTVLGMPFAGLLPVPEKYQPDIIVPSLIIPGVVAGLIVLLGGGAALVQARARCLQAAALVLALSLIGFALVAHALVLPRLDRVRGYTAATLWMRERAGDRPFGLYFANAQHKRCGFRVNDPAYLPLHDIATPEEAERWLADEGNVLIIRSDVIAQLEVVSPAVAALPRRQFQLSSNAFTVVGHPVQGGEK
ncbi:MAG: glycosyltransferase family 39 protein [Planctomycetota bacterium]|jgi:4-amino-4-deoxy-L-arabinose transferase-like glycosyltransferase|nr:glycosyltransferase family 39 protein [Planctomycetota bacterium]